MKTKLMEILACPVCRHHPLELEVDKKEAEEIITGTIKCAKCGNAYPIQDSIPNMLPPELR
ncbi:MAG: methytransferase partner Trm112 [Thermoplasmata archaeon]|nr:methytransferase partner Trm112 [Candidatus Sysuiplasma acidicola]